MAYLILAYVALGLQSGLGAFVRIDGAVPNLGLLAVIFIAINAPREAALLGCFSLGLMQDLLSQEPLGVYALAYGFVTMIVLSSRPVVYREHPLTHCSMALAGGLITGTVLTMRGWIHPPGLSPMDYFFSALYTAGLAPFVLGGLQRMKRVFGFEPGRRKIRAW